MVISALTSSKFYRLPPDRENPGNIVNCTSWENRGQRGVKCESCNNCQEKLFAYGKTKPLERTFQSEIYCEESEGLWMILLFLKVKKKLLLERALLRN